MAVAYSETYFGRLRRTLAPGLACLDPEARARHGRFILSRQCADGGFAGRQGGSDLYYTAFAVRGLFLLDRGKPRDAGTGFLSPDLRHRVERYLDGCRPETVVDLLSWLSATDEIESAPGGGCATGPVALPPSAANQRVDERSWSVLLERFRSADGGYGRRLGAAEGSTYQTFLAALCYDLLGRRPPEVERLRAFVASRRREDGGFAESSASRRSSTNATSAGVALAMMTEAPTPRPAPGGGCATGPVAPPPSAANQAADGGWAATEHAPVGDLLSTFTTLWTLATLGALDRAANAAAAQFVAACETGAGGFRGGLLDDTPDVEYTYYGLGAMALLSAETHGLRTTRGTPRRSS